MNISEHDLCKVLDKLDTLVTDCVSGKITFNEFKLDYGYPVGEYALDGHESNDKEKKVLVKLKNRLILHERITKIVLDLLCSEQDSDKSEYQQAGRIGNKEALGIMYRITNEVRGNAT